MKNRFELEQQILNCWTILDDIQTLFEEVVEGEPSKDDIANCLLGIQTLYAIKFDKLFRTFEQCLSEETPIKIT